MNVRVDNNFCWASIDYSLYGEVSETDVREFISIVRALGDENRVRLVGLADRELCCVNL